MNQRCPPRPSQAPLQFDHHQDIWQRLPVSDRTLCRDLLVQILIEVTRSERSNEDERQD
jgi:hypothetical protein